MNLFKKKKPELKTKTETLSENLQFNAIKSKLTKQEVNEHSFIVWVDYDDSTYYPIGLLGVFLQYSPPSPPSEQCGVVYMEALNSIRTTRSLGYVEAEAILPVIFGDDASFEKTFEPSQAATLNTNLAEHDLVIFIDDIPEKLIITGLVANVVSRNENNKELTVCSVLNGFDKISSKRINVSTSTCAFLYYADNPDLGKNLGSDFCSSKIDKASFFGKVS